MSVEATRPAPPRPGDFAWLLRLRWAALAVELDAGLAAPELVGGALRGRAALTALAALASPTALSPDAAHPSHAARAAFTGHPACAAFTGHPAGAALAATCRAALTHLSVRRAAAPARRRTAHAQRDDAQRPHPRDVSSRLRLHLI